MPVKKEPSGRRSVQVEVELPGTPEQIWQAIATGAGISSWFCPTQVEERVGGKVVNEIMPGMESVATISVWDPPRRLAAEDAGWAPGMPPIATEWTVEAREGGKCLVRVVHSLFASTDDWDNQLQGTETGWPSFFRILRIYLTHYRGQLCSQVHCVANFAGPETDAWKKLADALGIAAAREGQRIAAPTGPPAFSGVVEKVDAANKQHIVLLRLEQPAPGVVSVGSFNCGGMVMACVSFYLYGEGAAPVAKREAPLWQAWLGKLFPQAEAAAPGA